MKKQNWNIYLKNKNRVHRVTIKKLRNISGNDVILVRCARAAGGDGLINSSVESVLCLRVWKQKPREAREVDGERVSAPGGRWVQLFLHPLLQTEPSSWRTPEAPETSCGRTCRNRPGTERERHTLEDTNITTCLYTGSYWEGHSVLLNKKKTKKRTHPKIIYLINFKLESKPK